MVKRGGHRAPAPTSEAAALDLELQLLHASVQPGPWREGAEGKADGGEVEGAHTAGCMHGPKLIHNQSEAKQRME